MARLGTEPSSWPRGHCPVLLTSHVCLLLGRGQSRKVVWRRKDFSSGPRAQDPHPQQLPRIGGERGCRPPEATPGQWCWGPSSQQSSCRWATQVDPARSSPHLPQQGRVVSTQPHTRPHGQPLLRAWRRLRGLRGAGLGPPPVPGWGGGFKASSSLLIWPGKGPGLCRPAGGCGWSDVEGGVPGRRCFWGSQEEARA